MTRTAPAQNQWLNFDIALQEQSYVSNLALTPLVNVKFNAINIDTSDGNVIFDARNYADETKDWNLIAHFLKELILEITVWENSTKKGIK